VEKEAMEVGKEKFREREYGMEYGSHHLQLQQFMQEEATERRESECIYCSFNEV
jgi:hypothetical protein